MNKKTSMDMVNGPIFSKILLFSLPLMATNILQMLFSAVDMMIVGRFGGFTSLAAVGSTTFVVSLFVNTLVSLSVGVNVVIARYIGISNREKEVSKALHTALTIALIGGVIMCILGILASKWMMGVTKTPMDVRPLALLYIRIYFLGTPLTMFYNFAAVAMRATGDTKKPLLYLSMSGVLNVLLNLIFVVMLHMDVAGVATATVLSQGMSAGLILRDLMKLKEVSAVNSYGSAVIAGYSAATSVEGFLIFSMNAFTQACQTFVSQNYGAGKVNRIGRIVKISLLCILTVGISQSILAVIFSDSLIGLYNSNPAVIKAGAYQMLLIATVYVIYGIADGLMGAVRGCGVSIAPVVINLIGTCLFRLVWIGLIDTSVQGVGWVYISFPISWILINIFLIPLWAHVWKKLKINQKETDDTRTCTWTKSEEQYAK